MDFTHLQNFLRSEKVRRSQDKKAGKGEDKFPHTVLAQLCDVVMKQNVEIAKLKDKVRKLEGNS